jgi:hypothetical protein
MAMRAALTKLQPLLRPALSGDAASRLSAYVDGLTTVIGLAHRAKPLCRARTRAWSLAGSVLRTLSALDFNWSQRRRRFPRDAFFDLFSSRSSIGQKLVIARVLKQNDEAGARYRVFGRLRTAIGNQTLHVCVACIGEPAFPRARRDDDGRQMELAVSDHHAECDARVTEQHHLDKFGTDISAERCDDEAVLASMYRQKTVSIDCPEIACPPRPL